jgi:hypothetical protein
MMPRDKLIYAAQGVIVVYVLYQVTSTIYQHLKAKDRLKREYTYFLCHIFFFLVYFSHQTTIQRQRRLIRFSQVLFYEKHLVFFQNFPISYVVSTVRQRLFVVFRLLFQINNID